MGRTPRTILLVDDSELTLLLEEEVLAEAGYEVQTATSFAAVEEILGSWAPEIVLTDVSMPDVDGQELCRRVKAMASRPVAVILFSSRPDAELDELARSCGADGAISKSSGLEALPGRLEALLRAAAR